MERPLAGLTDDELDDRHAKAEDELADWRRRPRRYRADAHAAADALAEGARQRVRTLLRDQVRPLSRGDTSIPHGLGDALAMTMPSVLRVLHSEIDRVPAGGYGVADVFGPLDRAEAEEKTAQLRAAVALCERERRWRAIDAAKVAAEAEEAALLAAEEAELVAEATE